MLLRADTRVELLRGLPLFELCSKRDLRRIAAIAVERELELGVLRELPMVKPAMEFGFCLAWRKGEEPAPPVLMLLERLRAAPGYMAAPGA